MDNTLLKMYNLLYMDLVMSSPYLSGNMLHGIKITHVGKNEVTIEIEAKFYDLDEWMKTKKIKHTGKNINGITDYAMWVNELGGFATHNDSEHWVNRVCNEVVDAIANEIGAEKINELEL